MESHQNFNPVASHHVDTSRPSLGFPLGTALLLIVIFSLSGFFSCCYHWEKIRSLRRRQGSNNSDDTDLEADHGDILQSPTKVIPMLLDSKVNQNESMPVIMPGDKMPKFIALPCPSEPPRLEKITIEVQASPSIPPRPSPPRPSPPPTIVYSHVAHFPVYYDG